MREKVYLETTVISYLTAWRSPQLLMAAHQEATRIWWDEQKNSFDIFTSEGLCCMKTGGAVLPPVSCDLCFFGYRIGLGFGQRPHPVEHGTAHPCFGLLVG